MTGLLAESNPASGHDPLHEVYDFAAWAAELAPADSRWPSSRSSPTPSATASWSPPASSPTIRRAPSTGPAAGPAR